MFDLDKEKVQGQCEICGFWYECTIKQARLDDVLICRGCKANLQLRDRMGTVKQSVRRIRRAMANLSRSLGSLEIKIEL